MQIKNLNTKRIHALNKIEIKNETISLIAFLRFISVPRYLLTILSHIKSTYCAHRSENLGYTYC